MKKLLLALSYILTLAISVTGTVAYVEMGDAEKPPVVYTSGMDIQLSESMNGSELATNNRIKLSPGKKVEKQITITNNGGDAWIWYTFSIPQEVPENVLNVEFAGDNWTNNQKLGTETIDGKTYNVYGCFYNQKLKGQGTVLLKSNVSMNLQIDRNKADGRYYWVKDGVVTAINCDLDNIEVLVSAHAIEAGDHESVLKAYEAYMN